MSASPLFAQRGLNFAHPDQRAEVLHLSADLRHVQAAHVVEVLVRPSRLTVREEPRLQRLHQPLPAVEFLCFHLKLFNGTVCTRFFTLTEPLCAARADFSRAKRWVESHSVLNSCHLASGGCGKEVI